MPRKDSSSHKRPRGKDKQKDRYAKYGKFTGRALRNKEKSMDKNTKINSKPVNN